MSFTTIFIAIAILLIFIYVYKHSLIKEEVAKSGGMLNKYEVLINEFMTDDENTQVFKVYDTGIFLGVSNVDGHTTIIIKQERKSVKIDWIVNSATFGLHKLEWRFPDDQIQRNMMKTIRHDILNYNVKVFTRINDDKGTDNFNDQDKKDKKEMTESLSIIAANFNCKMGEVKDIYFKKMDALNGSKEDYESLYKLQNQEMIAEAKKYGMNPNNTPSAFYRLWTEEYLETNEFDTSDDDLSLISDLHESNPELLSKLIDARRKDDDDEFEKLLAANPEYLDSFISKLADLADKKKDEIDDDSPF